MEYCIIDPKNKELYKNNWLDWKEFMEKNNLEYPVKGILHTWSSNKDGDVFGLVEVESNEVFEENQLSYFYQFIATDLKMMKGTKIEFE